MKNLISSTLYLALISIFAFQSCTEEYSIEDSLAGDIKEIADPESSSPNITIQFLEDEVISFSKVQFPDNHVNDAKSSQKSKGAQKEKLTFIQFKATIKNPETKETIECLLDLLPSRVFEDRFDKLLDEGKHNKILKEFSGLLIAHANDNDQIIFGGAFRKGMLKTKMSKKKLKTMYWEEVYVYTDSYTDWYQINGDGSTVYLGSTYNGTTVTTYYVPIYGNDYDPSRIGGPGGGEVYRTVRNNEYLNSDDYDAADPFTWDNIDPSRLINVPNFKCVYENFLEGNYSLFNQTIKPFHNASIDLVFDSYANLPSSGQCSSPGSEDGCTRLTDIDQGKITIYIRNPQDNPLDLAGTILHEGLHAAIGVYVNNKGVDVQLLSTERLLELYDYYNAVAPADHYYMTETYIDPLANALRQLDNYSSPLESYYPLAWDGLRRYGARKGLSNSQMYFVSERPVYAVSNLCK